MKIAIVCDSSLNLDCVKNNEDVFLVPLNITREDCSIIKDDGLMNDDEFYKLLASEKLKTSQSIVGDVINMWEGLLKKYDHIICVLLSKGLSGQFSTSASISNDDEFKNKVTVIDTNGVSVINERILLKVKEMINDGKNPNEIKSFIEERSNNASQDKFGFIIPKSLEQLVRGGRISKGAALLAKLAKIVPILKYNGSIEKETKVRLFKKSIEYCVDYFKKKNIKIIDISYSRTDEKTLNQVKTIVEENGLKIGMFSKLPNTIITHTGENTFSLINAEIFQ